MDATMTDISREAIDDWIAAFDTHGEGIGDLPLALRAALDRAEADLAEMTRRRDEWRAKAEGYDDVRLALREAIAGKFGEDTPRTMSRILWAGMAADQKKRADDAEADKAAAVVAERERVIALLRTRSDEAIAASIASGGAGQFMVAAADGILSSVLMQMVAAIRAQGGE